jgi:tRNA-Thr(GGU) m(6)t(6)A37 methyltransferase TsaA
MSSDSEKIVFEPIGYFHSDKKHRFETPRQGVYGNDNEGVIILNPHKNYEQALRDLNGFDRIWVIYHLHLNTTWKPIVKPPVTGEQKKISLFATRSPHRPNSIGMSCVELVKIDGLKIHIKNFDLLDNTPIIDIKPYVPSSDSFPSSKTGWIPKDKNPDYKCSFTETAEKKMEWIFKRSELDLKGFAELQLSYEPLNFKRKRVAPKDEEKNLYQLSCRTWRILFFINKERKEIEIIDVSSGYEIEELDLNAEDKYGDKDYHRGFIKMFGE